MSLFTLGQRRPLSLLGCLLVTAMAAVMMTVTSASANDEFADYYHTVVVKPTGCVKGQSVSIQPGQVHSTLADGSPAAIGMADLTVYVEGSGFSYTQSGLGGLDVMYVYGDTRFSSVSGVPLPGVGGGGIEVSIRVYTNGIPTFDEIPPSALACEGVPDDTDGDGWYDEAPGGSDKPSDVCPLQPAGDVPDTDPAGAGCPAPRGGTGIILGAVHDTTPGNAVGTATFRVVNQPDAYGQDATYDGSLDCGGSDARQLDLQSLGRLTDGETSESYPLYGLAEANCWISVVSSDGSSTSLLFFVRADHREQYDASYTMVHSCSGVEGTLTATGYDSAVYTLTVKDRYGIVRDRLRRRLSPGESMKLSTGRLYRGVVNGAMEYGPNGFVLYRGELWQEPDSCHPPTVAKAKVIRWKYRGKTKTLRLVFQGMARVTVAGYRPYWQTGGMDWYRGYQFDPDQDVFVVQGLSRTELRTLRFGLGSMDAADDKVEVSVYRVPRRLWS